MKTLAVILAALLSAVAGPAAAQIHENGVARSGQAISTRMGGSAFMCRAACSVTGGCSGWNWLQAGMDGPQARCTLMTGAITAKPDACCQSGLGEGAARPLAANPLSGENRYAGRSQTPNGPPVDLANNGAGLWGEEEEEDEAADESENAQSAQTETPAPGVAAAPSARITSQPNTAAASQGQPRYSVQREYSQPQAQPQIQPQAQPQPANSANPVPNQGQQRYYGQQSRTQPQPPQGGGSGYGAPWPGG